ncbi:hypothetical protein V6N12_068459 [Hibiscus sabdariffa]
MVQCSIMAAGNGILQNQTDSEKRLWQRFKLRSRRSYFRLYCIVFIALIQSLYGRDCSFSCGDTDRRRAPMAEQYGSWHPLALGTEAL